MQVTELPADGLKRQFKIVIPAGDLAAKVDRRVTEMARTASMPGFRPGKVPAGLLKKQYGQALLAEALEQSVNDSTTKAIEDRGLKPALQPRVDLKSEFAEGKDVEFEVAIEVLPEIGQLDFSGIELERLKAAVPDKDVDEALQRIAKANREQKPVDPPRAAQKGDALKLDFVGSVDGVEFPGGEPPDDLDFAYFAFTIAMCFQVSDATVSSRQIRHTVLAHALLAFAYNTVILALALNLIVGQLS